jgi:thioredoxin reductase (NADPH)
MAEKEVHTVYDLIIIGSGAAGLAAGIYAGRYRMNVLVIGEQFGGETATGGKVENYPGFKSIDGLEMMLGWKDQAEALRTRVIDAKVKRVEKEGHCFRVFADDGKSYLTNTLVFAMGSERRRLGLPNEKELTGRGVHYCITCDGPLYSGKNIAVVGGGDASVKGVNLAAEYAKKIYLIVRGKEVMAEPINYERLQKLGERVEILYETEVKELVGSNRLGKVVLSKPYKDSPELIVDGLFVEIGAQPNVELAVSLGVELDDKGYIKVDNMMRTNIDGVFAAGDATNHFGRFKQDITAAAMGAVAATSAYDDHKVHGELCQWHAQPSGHKA